MEYIKKNKLLNFDQDQDQDQDHDQDINLKLCTIQL